MKRYSTNCIIIIAMWPQINLEFRITSTFDNAWSFLFDSISSNNENETSIHESNTSKILWSSYQNTFSFKSSDNSSHSSITSFIWQVIIGHEIFGSAFYMHSGQQDFRWFLFDFEHIYTGYTYIVKAISKSLIHLYQYGNDCFVTCIWSEK